MRGNHRSECRILIPTPDTCIRERERRRPWPHHQLDRVCSPAALASTAALMDLVDDQLPTLNPPPGHLHATRFDVLDEPDRGLTIGVGPHDRVLAEAFRGQLLPALPTTSTSPARPEGTIDLQGRKLVSTRHAAGWARVEPGRFPIRRHSETLSQHDAFVGTEPDRDQLPAPPRGL
jgi:hypothetical protein